MDMAKLFAGSNPEISEREKRNMERSRRIAGQGMVLLKNENSSYNCFQLCV